MGGGAWPFLVGGAICLVNSVNERDLNLLNSRAYLCVVAGGRFTAAVGGHAWAINPCQLSRAKPGCRWSRSAAVHASCMRSPAGPTPVSGGPGLGVFALLRGTAGV